MDILISRLIPDAEASIGSILTTVGIPQTIRYSMPLDEIVEKFFSPPFQSKPLERNAEKFIHLTKIIGELQGHLELGKAEAIFRINDKIASAMLKELVHQRLSGFYFLSSIGNENVDGHVILLREVSHLTRAASRAVAQGLDAIDGESLAEVYGISFEIDEFAMPIGEVSSPCVEHIMQTFSHLFGRIGLEDPTKDMVDKISASRPKVRLSQ